MPTRITRRIPAIATTACAAAAFGLGTAYAEQDQDLRYAIGFPDGSMLHDAALEFSDMVGEFSDDTLSVNVYPLTLLNFEEMSGGIQSGIADLGGILTGYFPSEYPSYNMIGESTMFLNLLDVDDVKGRMAFLGAMNEFTFNHCPECHEEFQAQNQVFTGGTVGGIYELMCDEPVQSMDDLDGTRLRAGGPQWARWTEEVGASSVSLSANEAFEALNHGVVDCVIIAAPELVNLGIIDAVSDITSGIPGGTFAASVAASANADTWKGLSENQREAVLQSSAYMGANLIERYVDQEEEVMGERIPEEGITVHEPDDELVDATETFTIDDLEKIAANYADRHDVERAEEMLETFEDLLHTWVERVEDVDSAEELGELYWEHVFSEVDVTEHGM